MTKYLDIDLNEVVNEQVRKELEEKDYQIELLKKEKSELSKALNKSAAELKKADLAHFFITALKIQFDSIQNTKDDNGYSKNDIYELKFNFIGKAAALMGVNKWEWYRSLKSSLCINLYDYKDVASTICPLFFIDQSTTKDVIDFVMPYDWSKEKILSFLEKPHVCTNSEYFRTLNYWDTQSGENTPYGLIFSNKHMLDEDSFSKIISIIEKKSSNWELFLSLPKYSAATDGHIARMGRALINIDSRSLQYEDVKNFVSNNLVKFDKETVDYFAHFITTDNQFNSFHWEKFPVWAQRRFLLTQDFPTVVKRLSEYHCKWTDKDREEFMREYFEKEKNKSEKNQIKD